MLIRFKEHTFIGRLLDANSIVIDAGANIGSFSEEMARRYGCRCYAIEPNPACFAQIPATDHIKSFNLAIAAATGERTFYLKENSESSSLLDAHGCVDTFSISTRGLEEFIKSLGLSRIGLLKMDVEGAEIEVLDDCSDAFLLGIEQITVEFHDFTEFVSRRDVERIILRLESLGFFAIHNTSLGVGHADTLFVNRNLCGISLLELIWAKYMLRNYLGLKRVLMRKLQPVRRPSADIAGRQ